MLRKIDCVMIRVADVEAVAAYYTRVFGLLPQWSGDDSIGLAFPETDAEVVLHNDPDIPSSVEVYYLVDNVVAAVDHFVVQGCQVLVAPFDITIGKCAVISDPFGAQLCILDLTPSAQSCWINNDRRGGGGRVISTLHEGPVYVAEQTQPFTRRFHMVWYD